MDHLNWGDDDKEPDAAAGNKNESETDEHSSIQESETDGSNGSNNEKLSSTSEYSSLESHDQRSRRQPCWMRDYESREGFSEEENMTTLVILQPMIQFYSKRQKKMQSGEQQWMQRLKL